MARHIILVLILISVWAPSLPGVASAEDNLPLLQERVRDRIRAVGIPGAESCRGEYLYARHQLARVYDARAWRPVWMDERGLIAPVDDLVSALRNAYLEGLTPDDYHLAAIESLIDIIRGGDYAFDDLEICTDIEMLLTDAFLTYGANLSTGRVDPETFHMRQTAYTDKVDLYAALEQAVTSGEVSKTLDGLKPPHTGYQRLKDAIARYRTLARAGDGEHISSGPKLKKGDAGGRVALIRTRLVTTGDLADDDTASARLFDETLETAVIAFQHRHGLDPDGVVGAKTLAALNEPSDSLVRKMELNLERWRWLPRELGKRHVLVNSAAFRLEVIEIDEEVMTMRVVVGRNVRSTPEVSSAIAYMVLNPFWNVPTKLAVEDIGPHVLKNPRYLAERKIKIFRDWSPDAVEIDPARVNWKKYTAENFPFKLRQDPGPKNPLGRIKFIFPNRHDVYLHDTPERNLFNKTSRGFSSGCIRIEKPLDFATFLLRGDPEWSRRALTTAINSGETRTVHLKRPVPVHLFYWTAWVDRNGTVQFREDIYERDALLNQALMENPSTF